MFDPKAETKAIKWLFGEIIYYRNNARPIPSRYLKWMSHVRTQKIIFNTIEKCDLPITRSWYLWGGYVHTDQLIGDRFSTNKSNFSRNPQRVEALRAEMYSYLPVDEVLSSLHKITDYVLSMSSKDYLPIFYEKEVPTKYKEIYLSKQNLSDIFYDLSNPSVYYDKKNYLGINTNFDEYLYAFLTSSRRLINDDVLNTTVDHFIDIVESSLDKIVYKLIHEEKISNNNVYFYKSVRKIYNDYIWKPFACRVSQETVVGIREKEEKKDMMEKEYESISEGPIKVNELSAKKQKSGLSLKSEEYEYILTKSIDKELAITLIKLMKIYDGSE